MSTHLKTLCALLSLSLAGAAQAAPDLQVRLAGGVHVHEDAGFDVVSEQPQRGAGNIGVDYRLMGPLWLSADFDGGAQQGELFARDSSYDTLGLGLGATWKDYIGARLKLFGRASAVARRLSFEIGAADGNAWTFSGRAGVGLEWDAFQTRYLDGGFRLELTYERAIPVDVVASGTSLGTFDPSGPGALLGFYVSL